MADNPKSFDQAFKALSDADPRSLLGIFGVLPIHAQAEVEPLPRDLSMRPLVIDSGYMVRRPGRKPYIVLFEAVTSWKIMIAERLAWYGAFLGHKYEVPVHVYVVPLTRESCPRRVPAQGLAVRGGVTVTARLHWIKPWEIDARIVLDLKSPTLDPWAVLFRVSDEQLIQTIGRLKEHGVPLFRILGGMRYRRREVEWRTLLERMDQMIRPELLRESLAVQEWLAEGRVEGRVTALRDSLTGVFQARFPGAAVPVTLNSISDAEVLSRLIPKVATAKDAQEVERLLEQLSKTRTS